MKPSAAPIETIQQITEEFVIKLRGWTPDAAATVYDRRVRDIERQTKTSYIEMGLILNEVEDRELFRRIIDPQTGENFRSFDRWLSDAAPVSRSGGYSAKKAIRELKDAGAPLEQMKEMSRSNVVIVSRLPGKLKSDPEVIEAAQTMPERTFRRHLESTHPEAHIEDIEPMRFMPEKSQRAAIDEAIEAAMVIYSLKSREAALEAICAFFLDGVCDHEKADGNESNREVFQAFTKANGRGAHV